MSNHDHGHEHHAAHSAADEPREPAPRVRETHPGGHGAVHGHDHGGMIADFRRRFWVSVALTLPVLALSPIVQRLLGVEEAWAFRGDRFVLLGLSSAIFFYGGWPYPGARHLPQQLLARLRSKLRSA